MASSFRSVFRDGLFAGQAGIVTGAGSGIGRCTAHELAALGARVALVGRKMEKLEAVAREIADAGGEARCYAADIREEAMLVDSHDHAGALIGAQQVPDLVSDFDCGVDVADPGRLLECLGDGPEGDSLAVRGAPAPEHLGLGAYPPKELMHEARLADSCRTEEREQLARSVGGCLLECRLEPPAFALPTNERRIETLGVTGDGPGDGQQTEWP